MTRRDYLTLSAALAQARRQLVATHGGNSPALEAHATAARAIAAALAELNPAFDPARFIRDAGVAG